MLIKKNFVGSNGFALDYFENRIEGNASAYVFWFSAFTRGPLLGRIFSSQEKFNGFKIASQKNHFNIALFRDPSGLTSDGTYYYGKAGDPYVEKAFSELLENLKTEAQLEHRNTKFIAIGTSMGAYAAVKFAIKHNFFSAIALVPHFDLNVARNLCGRRAWIDWSLEDSNVTEADEFLNELQLLVLKNGGNLPRLFVHSAKDDVGVHEEQVLPFTSLYRNSGGNVIEDFRETGGHSMTNASNEYINAVLEASIFESEVDLSQLRTLPKRKESRAEVLERYFALFENKAGELLRTFKLLR